MSPPRRGRSLFGELVVPVVGLVLAAVFANVGFAAWLAVRRSLEAARVQQERVVETLASSRVPLSPQVLGALHQLTGSHFVVWDTAADSAALSTLPHSALAGVPLVPGADTGIATIEGRRYSVGTTRAAGVRPERVFILTPVQGSLETTLAATWPVLSVAAATLAVLVPLGLRTTGRLATRITAVERHVARIAEGDFGSTLDTAAEDDEVGRLVAGVNRMSVTLDSLRNTLVASERQRLLGQLAAGFAHELRNAITGARLAIDLHRRRCQGTAAGGGAADGSLAVACRQLDIVEEEVRGLLALGRPSTATPAPFDLDGLVGDVRDLTAPRSDHVGVRFECGVATACTVVGVRDALRAALVNLALNAIDAAGPGGSVELRVEADERCITLAVEDTGPGPPPGLAATLAEPFVTGKPEGIGLGLAVAKAVAEQHAGTLEWRRVEGRTRFAIRLPRGRMSGVTPTAAAACGRSEAPA